jgi:CheY-like chemotaxis protein
MNEQIDKKILVVDDSATMRMLITMSIKKLLAGINVTQAVNGVDAIEKLKNQDYHLVITDMNMPEMDGAQLIREIRGTLKKDMPIIIVTTQGNEGDRDMGLSLGANGYLTKPVDMNSLKEIAREFLAG